ncbi:hypothetical protein [Qipengyuania atrilutea]|uniref:Uncharacterized protein n=1 Tax=Qipengyuania atrilutea TaxID=2744473 RepID=A0A850GYB0_9SPHN|nr:hypothetical protein [Actirhodobacter atriluteus]NVD43476.1 hypothetical protein [Actirhodobacter atriluteus]
MRFHYTGEFSAACEQYDKASEAYSTFDDTGDDAAEREKECGDALTLAEGPFFDAKAYTPFEVLKKLDRAAERARDDFDIRDYYSLDAIRSDLDRLKRNEPSPSFALAFTLWRSAEQDHEDKCRNCDSESDISQASEDRAIKYRQLMQWPCATAGDFIAKQYVRLLGARGGCNSPEQCRNYTANPWDIDIEISEGEGAFDTIDKNTLYYDLDNCDVGMNLLAYGKLDFDAELWMEAADRLGQKVALQQQKDGRWDFWFSLEYDDEDEVSPRINRERDRLHRLLAWPGAERHKLVADEMRREWPQLVHVNPIGEAKLTLDEIDYSEEWTLEQLHAALEPLDAGQRQKVRDALRLTGDLKIIEAGALEAEGLVQ